MKEIRVPGFTADGSLGLFYQTCNPTQNENQSNDILPAMIAAGCCGGWCERPCSGYACEDQPGKCCCNSR